MLYYIYMITGELPKMYRPGFVPFKPKTQPKETKLPKIPEGDNSLVAQQELGINKLLSALAVVELKYILFHI